MQNKTNLWEALCAYADTEVYPFHMPGHKRNTNLLGSALPLGEDITEIDGFDNLHDANGILQELSVRIAKLWDSAYSVPLINGSTGGILAGIASVLPHGGSILVARNCHKSVYNAIELLELQPHYIVPPIDEKTGIFGSIRPEDVEKALKKHPQIGLVVLTSPTYDGVLSDVGRIVDIAHKQNVPVLVDEAHGAHLHFTPLRPLSAVACHADIVIQSLHKTLPAMTQCAVAHLNGTLVNPTEFLKKCAVFETSSPSYILLSSIALCVDFLEQQAPTAFADYAKRLKKFNTLCQSLSHLFVLCKGQDSLERHSTFFAFDSGKLPILTTKTTMNGHSLSQTLRTDFSLESEMSALSHCLCMTSVCDTDEGFSRLFAALQAIDKGANPSKAVQKFCTPALPSFVFSPYAASQKSGRFLPLSACGGKISLDTLWCYPPGIPLLVPGEEIEPTLLEEIKQAQTAGLSVQTGDKKLPLFRVLD